MRLELLSLEFGLVLICPGGGERLLILILPSRRLAQDNLGWIMGRLGLGLGLGLGPSLELPAVNREP